MNWTAYVALADVQRASRRDDEAEDTLRHGLSLVPDAADLHLALGLALVRKKRTTDALPHLSEAMRLAPHDPHYAYVYGVALHGGGDRGTSLRVLEQSSKHFPAHRDTLQALVAYSVESGDLRRAGEWAQRLVEIAPDDSSALGQLRQFRGSQAR